MGKTGGTVASVALWIVFGGIGAHFFGADGFLLIFLLCVLLLAITLKLRDTVRRRHFKQTLASIEDKDEQSIRFDGAPAQLAVATNIGKSKGWIAETLPETNKRCGSIRFTASEGAVSPQAFLEALIEADLVQKIAP